MLKSAISGRVVRNSHSHVVNELGKAIVGGTFRTGDLLPGDSELAERFDVSRTVLREAMKTLSAKGMVVPKARIGTRVTGKSSWNFFDADVLIWHLENGIDDTFVTHLSEMRLAFEPMAARLACERATAEDMERIRAAMQAMKEATSKEGFALADLDFHMALLAASKNPFMLSVGTLIEAALLTSFRLSSPLGEPQRHKDSTIAHGSIIEAIAAKDASRAMQAMEYVITDGRNRILSRVNAGDLPLAGGSTGRDDSQAD